MIAYTLRAALLVLTPLVFFTACQGPAAPTAEAAPPWVKTVPIEASAPGERQFSGTLRARHETPLALQVGGRVLTRPVQAGQSVAAGQTLLTLDAHDLLASEASAAAQLVSAEAAQRNAERELERQRHLVAQGFVSAQTLERFELALREAGARVQAARSQAAVARNLRSHAELRAPAAGVLLDIGAEPGQVLGAGQSVGTLAHAGEREIELFLPQGLSAPRTDYALLPDGTRQPLQLREVAGAAEPLSRTWRARYRLVGALDPAAGRNCGAWCRAGRSRCRCACTASTPPTPTSAARWRLARRWWRWARTASAPGWRCGSCRGELSQPVGAGGARARRHAVFHSAGGAGWRLCFPLARARRRPLIHGAHHDGLGGAPRFFISANPEQPNPAFAKLLAIGADAAARERIMADLQARIDAGEFPEARLRVARLLFGRPVPWPVSFRIVGPDPQQLRAIAQQVQGLMQAHPHTLNTQLDWDERALVLQIEFDAQRLRLLGLTPRELKQQLQFQLDGVVVSELRQGARTVQVQARGKRDGAPLLPEQIEIRTLDGRLVPLAQLGRFELRHEEPLLRRLNREPFLAVQADVRGAQPPTVTEELWLQMAALRAELPPGYRIDIGGTVERAGLANQSIRQLFPLMVALMLVFIMLQMRSFSGTFVVVATAPLGLVGAVLALLLFQQPFGFVALLGLIGLAGILMRNTMILTQQVQDNFADGLEAEAAVVEAAVQRARPVILTALAAALAFVPLTFDSFWGPLAYVLIGGVAVGTAITLFYVPALYALWLRIGHAPPPAVPPLPAPSGH